MLLLEGTDMGGCYIGALILTVSAAQVVYTIHCIGKYFGCVGDTREKLVLSLARHVCL